MVVTSHQVKGNSDVPSLQHSETITVLSWLSSMISQDQLLKERTRLSFYRVATWAVRVWFAVSVPWILSPSVPGWACRVWEHRCHPGAASSRLRHLSGNIYSWGVCPEATWRNPAQLREFMKRFSSPTLVSANPTEMLPISKGISHNIRCLCVDKFRPGSLFSQRV